MRRKWILLRASYPVNYYLLTALICCSYFVENVTSFETVEVYEGLPPGSAILNLKPKDGIAYSLYQDSSTADGSSLFYIDSNGVLTSKVTLDREDERGNVFDLLVISREIPRTEGGFGSIVRVRILDQNDNTPKFPKDLYTTTVPENSHIGTDVSGLESVFASDLDSGENSVQKYSIVAGNEAGKFEVDLHEISGVKFLRLKTKAPIDREETPYFVLTVQVEDGGNPILSSTTQVRVNILDENDQTPKFEPPVYSVTVSENVAVGTSVLQVKAFDADAGTNAEIYYYFKPEHDFFTINAHTGIVETACELTFQKGNSFDLTVYAVDRGRVPQQANTVVRIRLVDIAGYPPPSLGVVSSELVPPAFHKHAYFVRIREDFPVGGAIVRVEAHRGSGPQLHEKAWRYVILNEPAIIQTIFHINPRSGVITLRESLDYENKTSFSLIVKAQNEQSKDLYDSQTRVEIVIEDVNENYFAPIFARSTSVVSISENAPENGVVSTLSASDADDGSNGKIVFNIAGGSGLGKFNIDQNSGKIRSVVRFNSEMDSKFDLHVRASDRSKQPLHSNAFLLVKLQNSGQKRPFFFSSTQVIHVRENSAKGTFVALVRAKVRTGAATKDEPDQLEYFISGGNGGGKFSLNSTSGIMSTTGSLDRESKDLYILDVRAVIKGAHPSTGSPSQVVVMVTDENDNSPAFDQQEYKVVVTENMGPISNLLCLAANDPDSGQNGNITYSIISGTGPFSIDPVHGLLSVNEALDYEKQSLHRLVVQAADNGVPSHKATTKVEILVQDANDAPVFSQDHYTVNVLENSDFEGTVAVLETSDQDRDKNGKFTCSMEDMDLETMDTFTVRRTPEGCALVLSGYLDWSSANQYSFSIRATDRAKAAQRMSAVASVTINVQDTNNHDPEFLQSSYWVSLPNDANMDATVLTVKARDFDEGDNADIRYKLSSDMFNIHPTKGTITLKQGLGSVTNKKYEFSVRATDQGTPNRQSAVSVSVTVHSLSYVPPKFLKPVYRTVVPENLKTGVGLLTVHAQKNVGLGSSIEYFIVGGDPLNRFSVGTRSGVLTLRKQLDHEKVQQHVLVVRAVQKGLSRDQPSLPTEVKVIVNVTDVNDNRPRFALPVDPLVTSVDEFQSPGTLVTVVKAFDKDTGNHSAVTYRLNDDNFQIHPVLGTITTRRELYHSQGASRSFVVTATDSTPPHRKATANVVVMVNRASPPPQFLNDEFAKFVPENIPVGKSLVHFATQQESRSTLKYWISEGDDGNHWCIDVTAKIRVNQRLDHRRRSSYHLKINVQDGLRTYVGPNVLFNIEDINDNAPAFSSRSYKFYVSENLPEFQKIGSASAIDLDNGSNSRRKYSIVGVEDARSNGKFEINPVTGLLKTTRVLDREDMQQHVIIVRVEDHGKPPLSSVARVTVIVSDVNDNDPVFATDLFTAWVPVDAKVGSRIFTVVAFDVDWGENGILRYSIVEGNAENFVTVDPADGFINLARPLRSLKSIKFKIMARDLGQPYRNSTADVIIRIHAVAGPPRFLSSSYKAHVTENEKAETEVIRVKAASVDPLISYKILNGNENGDFHLHAATGLITTTKPLDYETVAHYELVVMAIDSSNRMNYVKVTVQVNNVNDNEPRFVGIHSGVIEGQILAAAIADSHVTWVKARDRDVSDVITYKILDKRAASYFYIDSEGRLRTKQALTGLQSPYVFRIEALDNGIPSKSAFTSVRIVLLKYHTQQKELQASVSEDVKQDAVVIRVVDSAGIKNPRFSVISPVGTPFRIDDKTGAIGTSRPLDFETTQNYTIIVQVQNAQDVSEFTNIDVVINILDVNDNSPAFAMNKSDGLFLAKVNRNPVQGTVVYKLTASDRDSKGHLRYSLVSRDDNAVFEVEAESGNVKTRGQQVLMADFYNVTVRVSDGDTPSRHVQAVLRVQVGEYPPVFSEKEYLFTIEENTQKGFTIGFIKGRSYSGASLSYTVVHGNSENKFILDSNTGRLALPNPLDHERDSNVYYIRIRAEEVSITPRQSSEVNVRILLKDVNDNAPEFSQQRYRYTLPESAPIGTTVLSVSAQDDDSGINGQFRYHMDNPYFTVNPYTGEITTTKPLDYEIAASHTFVVVAQDGGSPVLNGTARVEVTLHNVNDNPPRFSQSMYNEFVTEDAGPGELVTTVQASDLDLDPVSYSIMAGDNSSNFVIDSRTGVVRLVKHRQPNLIGPYYVLNISASDGLHVSEAVLTVAILDINNHKPVFRDCHKYRPVIAENLLPGSPVIQVSAEDGDMGDNGKVSYQIERPTAGMAYFEIDSSSGLVSTAVTFDREQKRSYQIRITGKDGGPNRQEAERLMGFCQVEIKIDDVNDNWPKFGNKQYKTSVKEDLEKGHSVLHVSASDKDSGSNSLITYSFEEPNTQFSISNTTGIISTKRSLTSSEYRFAVIARDNGNPPHQSRANVFVNVYKVGKDPPKFKHNVYTARVRESVLPGQIVTRVQATSPVANILIFYTIVNYPQPFYIDPATGVVRTMRTLDYELAPNYTVHIRAQDTQDPPLVSFTRLEILVEDVNDSPPEFPVSKYEGQVAENSPIGSSVIEVKAEDPDEGRNGRVSYKFARKESYDSFALDPVTGLITTKRVFDREQTGRYTLIVQARDHGEIPKASSCLVDVIINDKNDNAPLFERSVYNVSVFEDVARGTRILTVSAVDEDIGNNAIVNYYITSGNTGAAFAINKDLGQIVVASSLDRESQDYYELKIKALDGKNSGTAVVHIHVKDVNDNNPVFSNSTYIAKVFENQPTGSYVTTLSATDKDLGRGGVFLFSISGQGRDAFEIDPKTGVLRTIKSLDRETKARYDFLAFATDNPESETGSRRTGSCDVIVWIRDVNDNPPRFPDDAYEGRVQENQLSGARVMVLSAVDDDDPNENGNAVMSYEFIDDSDGMFRIDRDSGLITTSAKLDRELDDEYRLVVNATDRGHPTLWGQVEVKVKVTDDNDHYPRFVERMFFASVFENASIDSPVILLEATDEDIGINAKLRFTIVGGATEGEGDSRRMFHIVEDTGELQVARSLDYETRKDYKVRVKVSDSGFPSRSDFAEVKIFVQDSNDNPPVFSPLSYSDKVREDVIPGTFLLQVNASDSDTGTNKEFKFSIAGGDPHGQFRIDPDSGNLYVHGKLDREDRSFYILTVRATNVAMPPLYGDASVKVDLIDVNDNGPTFHPSVYHFSVKENTAPSQSIGKISVDDLDLDPPNGAPFSFEIAHGNDEGHFALNNKTGEFFTRATFDREKRASYMLGIRAWDSGSPRRSSITMLFVHILDDNDNQHFNGTLNLVLNSYQGKFPGGVVGKVYVVDKDTEDRRIYRLLASSSSYFSIERTTGMIVSRPNPPKGDYFLTARVSDVDSSFTEVICSVFIKVKEVTAEAVQNSMAIRLGGVSREGFVTTVLPRFKETLASILQTDEDNVDLFSVQSAPKTQNAIDVRFAAHGSPYYAPERMTAILKSSRPLLAKAVEIFAVNVLIIGVDECLYETCESGGCTNVLYANGEVEVISIKGRSFASIVAILTARCDDCDGEKKTLQTCESQPCLNGGTCVDTPEGYACRCFARFDGPNCEFTTRSFEPGEWLWLPPPKQCSVGSLSLEFASRETDGLLLYGGPTSPVRNGDVHDFIAVELAGGKILVSLSLGDRNDIVRVGVTSGMALNDGEWHHVEVYRNGTLVLVTVDKCSGAPMTEGRKARAVEDTSHCSSTARLKSDKNKMLNLNGPLQLGGISSTDLLYPKLTITSYKGCIRNVITQGKYYDLKNPSNKKGTKEGCPMLDQRCRHHQCDPRAKCVPSRTGYSCSCPFGFTGPTCGQRTRALSYADGSFTQYLFYLHKFVYDPRETKLHMQIRTRDPDGGVLMYNAGSKEGRFSSLEVVPYDIDGDGERELIVTYTLGSTKGGRSPLLQLTGVNVGDGQWHNISVVRERTVVTLAVDSDGDGYSVTEHLDAEHTFFVLDPTRTFIGGLHPPTLYRRRWDKAKDFVGCINDVRFNGYLLYYYNGTNTVGNARSIGVSEGCSASPVCKPNPCTASKWCRDIWRKYVCLPRLCSSRPCNNGGTCLEEVDSKGNSKFRCQCPRGFEGALCEVESSVVVADIPGVVLEDGLIIGLSVLVVTLILSICILIVYLRRSRPKKLEVPVDEDQFKRDNVANYRIEGGGEEDLEEQDHLRDILKSFETGDFSPCQSRFKLSGSNSDVSGPYVVMTPIKKEADKRQSNGAPGSKPVQKPVKPDVQETECSFSREESNQELPDSCSSPSVVSTPERRRRVRPSSREEVGERQTPEGGECGSKLDASPTRKLTEVFGLTEEEQEGRRSPPEGFSSPEKFSSLCKRERGNGASLQRPEKPEDENKIPKQNGAQGCEFSEDTPNESFAMENPLSRPNSELCSASKEDGLTPLQRHSLPPRKPPRSYLSRGVPPQPGNFLPEDAMQKFFYEGSGSPTISLSTLGDTEGDSEADDNYEYLNDMGEKFKKLAKIYGLTPSVSFSPHDEVIGE